MMNAFFSSPYYSITLAVLAVAFVILALLLLADKKDENDHAGLATRYFVIVLVAWLLIALYVIPSHQKEKEKTVEPPANTTQKANQTKSVPAKPETDDEEEDEVEKEVVSAPEKKEGANRSATPKNNATGNTAKGSSPENSERIKRIRAGKK